MSSPTPPAAPVASVTKLPPTPLPEAAPESPFSTPPSSFVAIILMTASMALFAVEDTFIKLSAEEINLGQILSVLMVLYLVMYLSLAALKREPLWGEHMHCKPVFWRCTGELIGTFGFCGALVLIPISEAAAILQSAPLMITAGAAFFLKEAVGWRRSSAIIVGFLGVLLVVQPGLDGFNRYAPLAIIGVLGLAMRDLATRRLPREVSSLQVSTLGTVMVLLPSLVLCQWLGGWSMPSGKVWVFLLVGALLGAVGNYMIVAAMRQGEVASIMPFRYSRLLYALILGYWVFDERPDTLMLLGSCLIVGSGLYTLYRETRLKRQRQRQAREQNALGE